MKNRKNGTGKVNFNDFLLDDSFEDVARAAKKRAGADVRSRRAESLRMANEARTRAAGLHEANESHTRTDGLRTGDTARTRAERGRTRRRTVRKRGMGALGKIIIATGLVVVTAGASVFAVYASAKSKERAVSAFSGIGSQLDDVRVIGESGLVAIGDAQTAKRAAAEEAQRASEEASAAASASAANAETASDAASSASSQEENKNRSINITCVVMTIKSDLKIKFVNGRRLVTGVPLRASVLGPDGGTKEYTDDDQDGIIYLAKAPAGSYVVTQLPIEGDKYANYHIDTVARKVTVSNQIAYKVVDVSDEIKKESQVNAAKEDTQKKDIPVESALKDTVDFVESNHPNGDGSGYQKIDKSQIKDPMSARLDIVYRKVYYFSGNVGASASSSDTGSTQQGINTGASNSASTASSSASGTGTSSGGTSSSAASSSSAQQKLSETNKISIGASTLSVGVSTTLSPRTDQNGKEVTWSIDAGKPDTGVVSLYGTTVTGKKAGEATLKATFADGSTSTLQVNVQDGENGSITLTPSSLTLLVGGSSQVKAQVSGLSSSDVTWTSSDSKVCTVDANGNVKGVGAGSAKVTATSKLRSDKNASVSVTVKNGGDVLKDVNGNIVYVKDGNNFREAKAEDYSRFTEFYIKNTNPTSQIYTGWQTLDGKTYYFDKNGNKVTGSQVILGVKYQFGADGVLQLSSGSMGIDVSKWNRNIDWNAVKNSGVNFAIIRCGYRGSSTGALIEDPYFRRNIQGAQNAGIKVGVYFFTQAVNDVEAVEEASFVYSLIQGYNLSFPAYLDVEASGGRADGIDVDTRTTVCRTFCQTLASRGVRAGIYANKTWLTSRINTPTLTAHSIWLAQYAAAPSYTRTRHNMWQYTSKGRIPGISTRVDMNILR